MKRRVSPEWLDELPAHDPRAIRSRRDLRRINSIMGHARLIKEELASLAASSAGPPRRIVEAGAGDGTFLLRVLKALGGCCAGAEVVLVDRQPIEPQEAGAWEDLGCHATRVNADVFEWLGDNRTPPADVLVANLFLHHFPDDRLRSLLALMAGKARLFIACEPRRSLLSLIGASLVGCIGCNDVTRHDAVVSVRAGFVGRELTAAWPREPGWRVAEYPSGAFSHCFVARRTPQPGFPARTRPDIL